MDVPSRARVAVIGGGFAGAATAYHLVRAGARGIVVLEREATAGQFASGRNAGLCRQLADDDVVTDLAIRGAAFLRRPPAGFAPAPLLRETGSLMVSGRPDKLDALAASAARHDLPCERVGVNGLLSRWPRLAGMPAAGALFFPTDGIIDIHGLLQGFLAGARSGGAAVMLSAEVKRFRAGREANRVTVETSRGPISVECVINAAGPWAGDLGERAGATGVKLVNYRRHLFVTERVPNLDAKLPYVWYLDEDEMYFRPEEGGLLLCGCDATEMEACDARVAAGAERDLAAQLKRLTPWLADLRIARAWACLRTFAADERPVVGWDRGVPWLFWVAGLGGHGAVACAAIGAMAAVDIARRLGD